MLLPREGRGYGLLSEAGGEGLGQELPQLGRDWVGKKDAALMKATLFGSALGGPSQFEAVRVQHIGRNRLEEAGGIILFGLGSGQETFDTAVLEGLGHCLVNGSVGGQGAGGGQGVVGWQNESVGEVTAVFDQSTPRVASDHGSIRWGDSGFLEVTNRYTRLIPGVESQDGRLSMPEEGFINRHVPCRGGLGVKQQAKGHGLRWEEGVGRARVASLPWFGNERG